MHSQYTALEGALNSLVPRWTTSALAPTSSLVLSGPGAGTLNGVHGMVLASQLSNLAAFLPTDCPTREKHGWLGDAQVTAPVIAELGLAAVHGGEALDPAFGLPVYVTGDSPWRPSETGEPG